MQAMRDAQKPPCTIYSFISDPPQYDGLDQTNEQIECTTDNCNNGIWVPWDCTTGCADQDRMQNYR